MAENEQTGLTVPSLGDIAATALAQGQSAMTTKSDNAEVFMLMNARDDNQIMRELSGVYAKDYVYEIKFKGSDNPVMGLSWSGIKEARRLYGGIDVDIVEGPTLHGDPKDPESFYTCKARAKDLRTGNATTAAYRQKTWGKRRGGQGYYKIEFAYEFAQSKAKRNAIAELLPQPLVKAWIADFRAGREDFNPCRVKELEEGKDFKQLPDKDGGSKKTPEKSSPPQGGGSRGNGGGHKGNGGPPPMTAPQFGMIHKKVRELGISYPRFMLDDSGEPFREYGDMPSAKKVSVGTASDLISKIMAGTYTEADDPTPAQTTPQKEESAQANVEPEKEPDPQATNDDAQANPEDGDFALS